MISVFICEDNEYFLDMISKCVQGYISMEGYDMEVVLCTPEPDEVIRYIEGNKVNGLYFLDVELGDGKNGVELARAIRQHDPRGFIAFVTSHPQYMQTTFEYQVEAMAYIQKADLDSSNEETVRQKIIDCIKNAYNKHVTRAEGGRFIFKAINGRMVSCEYGDILFFETDKGTKRIILHTKKRQYAFYGTVNELTKQLPKGHFFRCHKSSIVNVNNLTEGCKEGLQMGKDYMVMPDGTECYVAVRKRKELLNMMKKEVV